MKKYHFCPCGKHQTYPKCCGKFIGNKATPITAEELMRSRYTAYTKAKAAYIAETMRPPASNGFDLENSRAWAKSVKWHKLVVFEAIQENDIAYVEFAAYFYENKTLEVIHERSIFHYLDNRWFYVDATPTKHILV